MLGLIFSTPIVRLNRVVDQDCAEIWGKLESFNPGGSVKDRIALSMIETAERDGRLKPGMTIIEPTSGNTGIGLALVAAVKGYRMIVTMPDTPSVVERRSIFKAYGTELILTPAWDGMQGAIDKAVELQSGNPEEYFIPQQFENPANPEIHRRTTALEILNQMDGKLDAFVAGVGTGGTVTGVGEVLKKELPNVKIVAAEPQESAVLSGGVPGITGIEGWGAGFIPAVLNRDTIDEVITVSTEDASLMARRLAREEGILAGTSAGGAVWAALKVAEDMGPGKFVAVILPGQGGKGISALLMQIDHYSQNTIKQLYTR